MVSSANASDRFASPRRDEKVSYILRAPEDYHRFGISSLALGRGHLFTAGRDGTVRSWQLPSTSYRSLNTSKSGHVGAPLTLKHSKTFDEHVDWVNDVVLIQEYNRIVSCSSDTTLKVWNASDSRKSLRTLAEHTDYVKALTRMANGVASGSLDGRVLVWDLVKGVVGVECGAEAEETQRIGSVYCMSGSADGNTLVTGSTDKTISVWDVRMGDRVVLLRGHSDSVRCLDMKSDGRRMLSGGSDCTVKMWDLRQERCLRSFDSYSDGSVWAVAANTRFDSFVSGGRDGTVWHTDIASGSSSLVVAVADSDVRSNMVLDVALTSCNSAVWVSTTGSTVRLWPLPPEAAGNLPNAADGAFENETGHVAAIESEKLPLRPALANDRAPLCVVPGLPGIIAHKIMNDRRHVLTCDTQGEYRIWDITRGVVTKSLGTVMDANIDEVAKKHDKEVSVPSWFQVDIRLGSLSVRLEKSSVANAEIYAVDAGLDADSEEIKVNIGEHALRALFLKWSEEYKQRIANGEEDPNSRPRSPQTNSQRNAALRAAELPQYCMPGHISIVVTEDQSPVPILRRRVDSFDGTEQNRMPGWLVELLRDGKGQTKEQVKMSFKVSPTEGSGLPQLNASTLNAPRVLRVKKVAVYIAKELKESQTTLVKEGEDLDVLCNGQILPSAMSLATVKQFRWKSPGELSLEFRLKKSDTNH